MWSIIYNSNSSLTIKTWHYKKNIIIYINNIFRKCHRCSNFVNNIFCSIFICSIFILFNIYFFQYLFCSIFILFNITFSFWIMSIEFEFVNLINENVNFNVIDRFENFVEFDQFFSWTKNFEIDFLTRVVINFEIYERWMNHIFENYIKLKVHVNHNIAFQIQKKFTKYKNYINIMTQKNNIVDLKNVVFHNEIKKLKTQIESFY